METVVFFVLAAAILGLALVVVTTTRVLRAVVSLFLALAGVSGLYFLMRAPILGALQLMVYAGGIAVLFAFAVMLVRSVSGSHVRHESGHVWPGALVAAGFVLLLVLVWAAQLGAQSDPESGEASPLAHDLATRVTATGEPPELDPKEDFSPLMIREYLIPFELASVLLLVAMVGAVLIAHPVSGPRRSEGGTSEGTDAVVEPSLVPADETPATKEGGGHEH